VFSGVSQRCLKLSGEVEALIRGDAVGGAQVNVVVEPIPQLEQDRLEISDQLNVRPQPRVVGAASANGSRRIGAIALPSKDGAGCLFAESPQLPGTSPAPGSISSRYPHSQGCERCCHGPGGPFSYEGRKNRIVGRRPSG
jgi:hypothetical protein